MNESAGMCMGAIKAESEHQVAAIQRPCCFCTSVWCRNLDLDKVRRTEAGGFPDVMSAADTGTTLVSLCVKHFSHEPDTAAKHL